MLAVPIRFERSCVSAAARLGYLTPCLANHTSRQTCALPRALEIVRRTSGSTRNTMPPFPTPNGEPPAHNMVYFPDMTTALPSESREFRRIHTVDQILTFTSGQGLAQVGGEERNIKAGDMVVHKATTVHETKEEGDQAEEGGRDEPPIWSQRSKQENEEGRPVG
ncbi:hypothetical protein B0T21DRAFT_381420 [Apiosordaria backusii]|uniref:Cupin type-2 domain-containing protein n=1 Tax=Apiosordaria backusii TaxID=314023 RepID=A0AA40ETZ6_9PEZI|nr:hypothetical protein B0T21DRAFT_381420 [Apiosordaria backusii]